MKKFSKQPLINIWGKQHLLKNKSSNRVFRKLRTNLKEHGLFYLVSALASIAVSFLYLFGRDSGSNAALVGVPLDDTWIHLVYARSLAEQGWFFYNPGVAEAGMSSPLWVALLALVYRVFTPLGVSPQWVAKGLGLFFALGVPIITYHIVIELGLNRRWAWAAGLMVVLDPNLAYGNVGGMEVSLFTLLGLSAVLLIWRMRYIATGILLGLIVVTRGEGALTALLIGGFPIVLLYLKREKVTTITPEERSLGIDLFLPAFVLGSAWALYNYSVSGNFLPNSYYVKHDFSLGYFNFENLVAVLKGYFGQLAIFSGPGSIISLTLIAFAGYWFYQHKQHYKGLLIGAIPLVQVYAFTINIRVAALDFPWTYFTRRYLDFLIPFIWILLIVGAHALWKLALTQKGKFVILATPLAGAISVLIIGVSVVQLNQYFIPLYSWDTRNIEEFHVGMGKWIRDNLPVETTIAVTDAGAMRFWSRPDQEIVDFLGLNCRACIGRPVEELLYEFGPDFVVFFRHGLGEFFVYEELHSVIAERVTIQGGSELVAVKVLEIYPWPPE